MPRNPITKETLLRERAAEAKEAPEPPAKSGATLTIRLSPALRARLKEVALAVNDNPPPGSGFIRASESLVARLALERGLAVLEAEARARGDSAARGE